MAYPDNQFLNDQLESDQYGGRANGANTFDNLAWTWITGLVRNISKVVLSHVRVQFSTSVSVVQQAVVTGDVLAVDLSQDYTDPVTQLKVPYVGKFSTITTNGGTPKVIGVVVAPSAALAKAQYANGGLLAQAVSGLTSMAVGALVTVDATTNKLRAATVGEPTLGYSSPNGSVLLFFAGRVA